MKYSSFALVSASILYCVTASWRVRKVEIDWPFLVWRRLSVETT
jgi:hypothetical protein